jgi:cytoskeleton protein RodZ
LAFGQELRVERERQGISLASIAEITKVPQRHLLALELDRTEILPGGIFNKGILRSYCRCVGLDEEERLQRFPGQAIQMEPEAEWVQFAENISRSRVSSSRSADLRWWGVLAMFFALAAISWGAWRYVVQPQLQGATIKAPALDASNPDRPSQSQ